MRNHSMRSGFGLLVAGTLLLTAAAYAQEPAAPTESDRELAQQVEAAVAKAQGTPAQEMANMVTADWQAPMLKQLKGQAPAKEKDLVAARDALGASLRILLKGPDWPVAKGLRIPRAAEPIKVDGKLDDAAWKQAAVWEGLYAFNEREKLAEPRTVWRATWDDEYLYFALECQDADVEAPVMKRDDHVYFHDCVEMFVLPDFRAGAYWEIVVSPSGSIFDALHAKKFKGWGAEGRPEETVRGMQVGCAVDGTLNQPGDTDRGYTIEVAVPFAELPGYARRKPVAGDTLHLMLVRLDENGGKVRAYSFQPLLNWGHNIWNHAQIELAK
jgi:hypothetical protein